MAVASMHLGVWSWSRQSPELQTECQNGIERWFKQFWAWHGCWWQTGWSEYFTICSVAQPFLGFTKNGVKKETIFKSAVLNVYGTLNLKLYNSFGVLEI